MANHMMVWAAFGRPNQTVRKAPAGDTVNQGLYPSGYYLLSAEPSDTLRNSIAENEKTRLAEAGKKLAEVSKKAKAVTWKDRKDQLWKGWVLPASESDTWFVAGSAAYYQLLQSPDVDQAIAGERIRYRGLMLAPDNAMNRFGMEAAKGTLFLDSLRRTMGDDAFLKLMAGYFAANATKTVTAQTFLTAAGVTYQAPEAGDGAAYVPGDIRRISAPVIVYGTLREAGANRYAAEQVQARFRDQFQREAAIYKDFEAGDALLGHKDVIFVGRPETNSALGMWLGKIGLDYQAAEFRVGEKSYASERNSLVFAAKNPVDPAHMVLVYAGNSALAMAQSLNATATDAAWIVLEDGKPTGPSAVAAEK
jgi:hypothetical protein